MARSCTETEYKPLANIVAEIIWLRSILLELGLFVAKPPVLWCDNIGATYVTSNPIFYARIKHIEIDFHFIQDQVSRKQLAVQFITNLDQLVDALTKPLPPIKFKNFQFNLIFRAFSFRLRGCVEDHVDLLLKIKDEEVVILGFNADFSYL